MNLKKQILQSIILLLLTIVLFEVVDIDLWVEKLFYAHQHWLLARLEEPWRFIFYDGIKKLLYLTLVALIITLTLYRKRRVVQQHQRGLVTLLITLVAVPAVINFLKWYTDIPCPKDVIEFGGHTPYVTLFMHYPEWFFHNTSMRCYPAGHASGGFALMALYFAFDNPAWQRRGLLLGVTLGWILGIYKMAIGDHFLSHTVVSMLLAWVVACSIALFIKPESL